MIVWLPIPSAPGYEASSDGRVRNSRTGRELHQRLHHRGYLQTDLGRSGKGKRVNRLVCEAFCGSPPAEGRWAADHVDFDRVNNAWWNLRWLPGAINDFRWAKNEEPPADFEPMTDEEVSEWETTMQMNGW